MARMTKRGTLNTRDLQAAETRSNILDAAMKLVKTEGYNEVSVQQICRAAGVAKGTFYIYFSSKSDIAIKILAEVTTKMLREQGEQSHLSSREKLLDYICVYLKAVCSQGVDMSRELITILLGVGPVPISIGLNPHEDRICEILTEGSASGLWKISDEPRETSAIIQGMLLGMVMTWCFRGGEFDICGQANAMMETYLLGLETA